MTVVALPTLNKNIDLTSLRRKVFLFRGVGPVPQHHVPLPGAFVAAVLRFHPFAAVLARRNAGRFRFSNVAPREARTPDLEVNSLTL